MIFNRRNILDEKRLQVKFLIIYFKILNDCEGLCQSLIILKCDAILKLKILRERSMILFMLVEKQLCKHDKTFLDLQIKYCFIIQNECIC